MKQPLVSILVAAYNHEKYIEAAIQSVCTQSYSNVEVIVVDDGSPDETLSILQKLKSRYSFQLFTQENQGVVKTINRMIRMARGDYICLFASDDVMFSNRIERQVETMEKSKAIDICFHLGKKINGQGDVLNNSEYFYEFPPNKVLFEDVIMGNVQLCSPTAMFRSQVFERVGLYDETHGIEDFPFWLKATYLGCSLYVENIVLTHYRIHGGNAHQNVVHMQQEVFQALEKYREHELYKMAKEKWSVVFFSELSIYHKKAALKEIPKLWRLKGFWKRAVKILIPVFVWKKICRS